MKIFISHASEDKNRFVMEFATRLRDYGLDAWVDTWELKLGDSLADIFDAIHGSDVFISVISEYSIESRWVKEECDSALIRKIEGNIKFIPVILPGNFDIPNSMKHLLYQRINDLNDYDDDFDRIVSDIYGISNKHKIGNPPKYTSVSLIDNLEVSDTIVIKSIGDFNLENGDCSLDFDEIVDLTKDFELSNEKILDSLNILDEMDYVEYLDTFDLEPIDIKLTYKGCILYCKYYVDDFKGLINKIFLAILNENLDETNKIVQETEIKEFIVDAVLKCLESKKCIEIIETFDGIFIDKIFVKGKRYMKKFLEDKFDSKCGKLEYVLPDCNEKETIIFKDLCDYFLDKSFDDEIDPMTIVNIIDKYYDEADFDKLQERIAFSLKKLEENNYVIYNGGLMGMGLPSVSISDKGFCFYLKEFYINPTAYLVVIEELSSSNNFIISYFSKKYKIHYSIIESLIKIFRKKDFISCDNDLNNIIVTPQGKEFFESKLSKNIF